MATDNQGRNLKAVKKHFDNLTAIRRAADAESDARPEKAKATWQTFEGVQVLRVEDSPFVGVPNSGRKNAANFDIINIETRELVCQVKGSEVYTWLYKAQDGEWDIQLIATRR